MKKRVEVSEKAFNGLSIGDEFITSLGHHLTVVSAVSNDDMSFPGLMQIEFQDDTGRYESYGWDSNPEPGIYDSEFTWVDEMNGDGAYILADEDMAPVPIPDLGPFPKWVQD